MSKIKLGMIVQFEAHPRWLVMGPSVGRGPRTGSYTRFGIVVCIGQAWLSHDERDEFKTVPRGRRDFDGTVGGHCIVRCSTQPGLPIYFSKRPSALTHRPAR